MAKLTARRVETLKAPGHYVDGDGLALVIGRRGGKSWVLRTVVRGKRRDIGLGGVSWVSLAEARENARAARKIAREGGDPIAARKANAACPTFEEAAHRTCMPSRSSGRPRTRSIGRSGSTPCAIMPFPIVGGKPLSGRRASRCAADLSRRSGPISRRRRGAFASASAPSWTGRGPPATSKASIRWRAWTRGWRGSANGVRHHAALPFAEVPAFLRPCLATASPRLALRFLILTATRTGEVIGARWSEIDLDGAPVGGPGRAHEGQARASGTAERCGYGRVWSRCGAWTTIWSSRARSVAGLSQTWRCCSLLRRMKRDEITAHGFRSSFRDWAEEKSGMPSEIAELCLAHEVGNAVERAYRRSDLLEKRRTMMESWANHVVGLGATNKVVPLRART